MTKKSIKRVFLTAIVVFVVLLITGVVISIFDATDDRVVFTTYKDLMPLFLGIAAVWLGYCAQRRSAYQQQLRTLWTSLVEAVHLAVQYTYLKQPTEEQFRSVLTRLSVAIDEVRGVFCNLNESAEDIGFYPFEPIKDIYGLITDLGYAKTFKAASVKDCREKIFILWKKVRVRRPSVWRDRTSQSLSRPSGTARILPAASPSAGRGRPAVRRTAPAHNGSTPREARLPRTTRPRFALPGAQRRKEILKEFDREEPTFSHSHWADLEKARVYDDHRIPKKAT